MKNLFFLSLILLVTNASIAQNNVGIGTTSPNPNAILDIHNAGQALGLLLPKVDVTTFTPAANDYGMFVYDTLQNQIFYWSGTTWNGVSPGWTLFGNSGTDSTINFIGTTDPQALVFKTNNITRMQIQRTGNIGINGSPSLNDKLYVFRSATVGPNDFGPNQSNIHGYRNGGNIEPNGGIGWAYAEIDAAIKGTSFWGNNYSAGIAGYNYNDYRNSAAIIGSQYNGDYWGALGFRDSLSQQWGVYSATNTYTGGSETVKGNSVIEGLVGIGSTVFSNINLYINSNYTGAAADYGVYLTSNNNQNAKVGFFAVLDSVSTSNRLTGVDALLNPVGTNNEAIGLKSYIQPTGTGFRKGLDAIVLSSATSTGPFYGAVLSVQNESAAGTSYGLYTDVYGSSANRYGVYTVNEAFNYFSGNVGIGTTSPSTKLDVVQISTASPSARFFNGNTPYDDTGFQSSGIALHSASVVGVGAVSTIAALPQLSGNYPSILSFRTAPNGSTPSQERMRILANGRVGIGSFDAVNQLDVAGNMAIGSTYAGTNTAPANSLIVEGSVGIGIPAPAYPLHVSSPGFYGADFGTQTIYGFTGNVSNAFVAIGNNLGTPTSTPIYSGAYIAGYAPNPTGTNNYGVWGHQTGLGVGGWGVLATNGANRTAPTTYVGLAGGTYSAFFMGGNVGINTTTPNSQLQFIQNDASTGGSSAIRYYWGTNYWRTFHSGAHYSFEENGVRRAYVEAGSGNYVQPSDATLKKNITGIPSVLSKVNQLNAVSYHYNDVSSDQAKTVGFLAQEVEQIFPEIVRTAEDGTKALSYTDFSILAIKAIQEQQKQIEALQKEIQLLKETR